MRKIYSKKYMLLCAFLMMSVMAFAQTGSIKGKVLDETNQPLPGATVTVDGTTIGSVTDGNGNYAISGVKPGNYSLTAKFVGYVALQKKITVADGTGANISFQLTPTSQSLNEVVVIGYGTQSKKDVTGAITTVHSKDFQTGIIGSPEELIQGKVAGLSITTNGEPGAGSTIRIRQGASLNASNDPLIVIDGVPLAPRTDNFGHSAIAGAADPLSLINPDDIETFTILKDAASTAIYGSRASNGVIIITTKKGQSGAPKINFSTDNSLATPEKTIKVLSADQLRQYVAENYPTLSNTLGSANTDWQKEIYQTAFATTNNLSVSGTTKFLPYRVSIGYVDQDGILKTDNIKRTTAALRLNPTFLHNSLKIDLNLNGTYQTSRFANQAAIGDALSFNPTQPVYTAGSSFNGYTEYYSTTGGVNTLNPNAPRNPLGVLEDNHNTSEVYRSFGNANINYRFPFLPALTANANFGYDVSKGQGVTYVPADAAQSYTTLGNNTPYQGRNTNTVVEYYLNYTNNFKDIKSTVNAQAGYSYNNFLATTYNYRPLSANSQPQPNSAVPLYPFGQNEYTLISYYGRLIYTYDEKYTLQGTVRTDGSSKFSPQNRWGVFPGASFAWNINDENFLKGNGTLSDLKLRLSYGVTGNQDGIGYYGYLPTYSLTTNDTRYPFNGVYYNGYTPAAYDSSLKWEQTNSFNAGFDFGFLNQRIYGSVDVYTRKTKDLLATVPIPAGTNFTNQLTTNVGNSQSHGIELNLNVIAVRTNDLTWSFNYNIAYNKVTITNLYLTPNPSNPGAQTGQITGGTGNYVQINSVNYTPSSFYVYKQVYGANGKPLEGVYADLNEDGAVTAADEYRYHSALPPVIMGFSTQVTYKKWTASTVLRANIGNYVYNNVAANLATAGSISNNTGVINNATTDIYKTGFTGYNYLSDYFVQNASFLRMDNAGIGYNFGKIFGSKNITLRATANCQNVFVITKYTGLDPEVFSGIDNNVYPRPRTYTLGLNLGL